MKINERISIVLVVYLLGIPFGIIFSLFRLLGLLPFLGGIRIKGHPPVFKNSLILVYNHFSFLDPVLVELLYFPWYLINPFRFTPIGIPGKEDYYDKKWFLPFKPVCIPVKRRGGINKESLTQLIEALKEKRRITLPPEGGRTARGKDFLYSEKGKRIRKLQEGVGFLGIKTEAKFLPIWNEVVGGEFEAREDISFSEILRLLWQLSTKSKLIIKIGRPFEIQAKTRQEATLEIASALLGLADEE